ncbi:MAG: protein-glutamate O-methyltransferase CheR [Planctomycetota bacterium]
MDRDLTEAEFQRFHDLIYSLTGIHYPATKTTLLSNRLRKRLAASNTPSFEAYLRRLQNPRDPEVQTFLDTITTNETYFFRCQRHWDFFRTWAEARKNSEAVRREGFRIWSAAASTGAEAYTIAIVLHQLLGSEFGGVPVEIFGTDLSEKVLAEARAASFRSYALSQTPADVVTRYFRKTDAETFQFEPKLARVVTFQRHNLMEPLPGRRQFDFVFLRNVMIYFDEPSKKKVLGHAHDVLRPGGYLLVGESESLLNLEHPFTYVKPSTFQRPAPAGAGTR